MLNLIRSFFLGAAVATVTFTALFVLNERQQPETRATETLDFLIDEWTKERTPPDTLQLAQLAQRIQFALGHFPDTIIALARRVEELYRVPKGVTLAQWALESRYGLSDLGSKNFFGHTHAALKSFVDSLRWVQLREKTVINGAIAAGQPVRFARYQTLEQCFDAHGKYLSGSSRYRDAFTTSSPEKFARAIAKAGYATDPDYALKLIAIMRRYKL